MPGRRDHRLPAWLLGSGAIAIAMAVMNLGTYGFTILAARLLGPVHYGALAAVMGLLLVVNVLSLGLQATAARRVAAHPERRNEIAAGILSASYRSALGLGSVCLLASPLVGHLLHLDSWLTGALLAVTTVPLTVMGAQAGILQGERRWLPLAIIYLMAGVGRLLCGGVALWLRPDALGAMTGVAAGAFLPVLAGAYALRHPRRRREEPPAAAAAGTGPGGELFAEIAHNSHALLAFFALSNADVVIARSVLSSHDAGLYAAGLIMAKAVLFLPQFVIVLAFPAMSRADVTQRAHLKGLAVVLAIGGTAVAGVAALSALAVVFVGGEQYAELRGQLWAFAALGTVLALLQIMVYQVVASQSQRSVFLVWAALACLLVAAPLVDSVVMLLVVAASIDSALLVVLLVAGFRVSALPRASSTRSRRTRPAAR
jgi:O-antigen/teichoic acid export membrane protein